MTVLLIIVSAIVANSFLEIFKPLVSFSESTVADRRSQVTDQKIEEDARLRKQQYTVFPLGALKVK